MKKVVFAILLCTILLSGIPQGESFAEDNQYIGLRDPFSLSLKEMSAELQEEDLLKKLPFPVEIRGIVMKQGKKFIVINNDIVKEKDEWRGLTIDEISKEYLVVIYNQKKLKFFLKRNPI